MYARHFEGLFGRERRKYGGNAPREHRLACAGRTDHEHVMPAGHCHFEGALRELLSLDVGEVVSVGVAFRH